MSNLIYKLQTATFIIGLAAGSDYFHYFRMHYFVCVKITVICNSLIAIFLKHV